jgi:hypothetical protein
VLQRCGLATAGLVSTLTPQIQLDLAVRARRAAIRTRFERQEGEAA